MQSCAITDIGLTKQMNQDYIYASDVAVGKLENLYIVADGMGGHKAGDFASRYCVEEFVRLCMDSHDLSTISMMENILREINEGLIKKAAEYPDMDDMGTTFVVCTIHDKIADIANIGDSRLYIISGDSIKQITEDHSLVAEMVKNGDIKKEEARFHPKKNVVTRAISAIGVVIPDFFEVEVKEDDILLLCSDGLSNMVGDEEIAAIIRQNKDDPEVAARKLVDQANANGGKDNISVVIVRI